MKLELVNHRDVSYVELFKEEGCSLGLSVKSGTQRPVVKKVKPRSIVERSFAVAKGDAILSVNGHDTKWMSGKAVRKLIKEVGPLLCLKLEYEIRGACLSRSGIYRKQTMTLKLKKEAHTFGFILRKKEYKRPFAMEYPVVSNILPGGPAHREGSLKEGDRLLKVDNANLSCMSLTRIAKLLQTKGEAEFLIEYNIGVINASNIQNITEVEIDITDTDFGVLLNSSRRDPSIIYIEDIRHGSLAERCGAFSVGDIILSINGVNSDLLRISRANSLLYQMKEPMKIAITPVKDTPGIHEGSYLCTELNDSSKSTNSSCSPLFQNKLVTGRKNHNIPVTHDSESSLNSFTSGVKHYNTPVNHSGSSINSVTSGGKNHNTPINRRRCSLNNLTNSPKHYNTPVRQRNGRNFSASSENKMKQYCDDQSNALFNIRNIICKVNTLKSSLSAITRKAFDNAQTDRPLTNKNCDLCNTTDEAIHVCACCVMSLNTVCLQAMQSIRDLTIKFTNYETEIDWEQASFPCLSDLSPGSSCGKIKDMLNADIIDSLIDNLPEEFPDKSELKTLFQSMKHKFTNTASCIKCRKDLAYAFLISLKLFLFLSLDEQSSEAVMMSKKLVSDFAILASPCTFCNNSVASSSPSKSEANFKTSECLPSCSRTTDSEVPFANFENTSNNHPLKTESHKKSNFTSKWKFPSLSFNLREKMAFYKLTDLQSESGTDITYLEDRLNQTFNIEDAERNNVPQNGTSNHLSEVATVEMGESKHFTEEGLNSGTFEKHEYLEKYVEPVRDRCWRSVDSLTSKIPESFSSLEKAQQPKRNIARNVANIRCSLSREQASDTESNIANISHNNEDLSRNLLEGFSYENNSKIQNSSLDNVRVWPLASSNSKEGSTAAKFPSCNPKTSEVQAQQNRNFQKRKTHSEIMEVKLKNDGRSFGFTIGMNNRSSKSSFPAPSITSIKPNSPAFESGVLQEGDRILAMNGRGIVGLPEKDLQELISKYFCTDKITLTIEFDVVEAEVKSGTFKIVLDKTLKAGLEYHDKRHCCPWLVNGILRGSAAHRSGEIFAGDRILHFKCIRNDDFDPLTCGYAREEFVEFVIRRDSVKESDAGGACHNYQFGEPSRRKEVSSRGIAENLFMRRPTERNSKGHLDALVINQEVTLYKDPTTWDFGFLAGEDPETGEAYVKDIRPGGSAHASGVIKKFDKIIAVNGVPVAKDQDSSILSLLTQANGKLHMLIQRIRTQD